MTSKITSLLLAMLSIGLLGLNTSCKKVCGENLPQYTLSTGQRAWATPFAATTAWRFRNAAGYERTYRVSKSESQTMGSGGASKLSVCPSYYQEYFFADFERTDSTLTGYTKGIYHLQLAANNVGNTNGHLMQWNHADFLLAIDEVEVGQKVLAPATFGGRTYPAVLESTSQKFAPLVLHLYLTKAEGVVAFDDQYGTLWTRI